MQESQPDENPAPSETGFTPPKSLYALVLANLVPVWGVLFAGWNTFELMVVFWLENVVVGFYNVLRMIAVRSGDTGLARLSKFAVIPFFVVHYGIFTLAHGMFVFILFGHGGQVFAEAGSSRNVDFSGSELLWPFLALMISHGVSFWLNFIKGGEYRRTNLMELMRRPYGRVVVLHVTIIFGGIGAMALGSNWVALLILTFLKIGMDIWAHLAERRAFAGAKDRGDTQSPQEDT